MKATRSELVGSIWYQKQKHRYADFNFFLVSNMKPFLILCSSFFVITHLLVNCSPSPSSPSSDLGYNLSSIQSLCKSTPYPELCYDSFTLSDFVKNICPNHLALLQHSLQTALSEAGKLSNHFSISQPNIVETQKGTLQDCNDLHVITISSLKKSVSRVNSILSSTNLDDARAYLSAALTNKYTCLEGLDSASGSSKLPLITSMINAYKHVSNALSLLPSKSGGTSSLSQMRRRLMGFPRWISTKGRRILEGSDSEYNSSNVLTVAIDGTGNFTSLADAIKFTPNNSMYKIFIYVKEGIYHENVDIPSSKPNIVLIGDGRNVTVISSNRSVGNGWTTFKSATVAVSGEGFLARDITFENTAGPEKHQAVALRVNADSAAIYRCTIKGYQDTLYVHSFRQFYRECDIYGTIDFIFGNAAVVFQECNIFSRLPMPHQFTVITAQSRDAPYEYTGISIQNCSILPDIDLLDKNSTTVRSFLGRPWKNYSTTVIMRSYIDDHIAPEGWRSWSDGNNNSIRSLYYGEYDNIGPGSVTDNRVNWPGYHKMNDLDASNFTASEFITAGEWLNSTFFPYYDGI
ncbi:OLC1v1035671C1 [Oldenlandia corymbosa var. corymbosa]|uniref:Pectinesterase n=1 Tax=Oldenlandia corymbosa var. corymbosa TaxID=529605 RepID=A0AAV1CU12_OLDCO|nr:OLC1v1035671C1 [Oldenlandia corymbosa var. corymbosa]